MSDFADIEKPIVGHPRMRRGLRSKYVPNHRSFGAFIRSEQMRDVTEEVAKDVMLDANATAPPPTEGTDPDRVGAAYKVTRQGGLIKVSGNLRVRVLVESLADDGAAARAEFGHNAGEGRYRHLANVGSRHGQWKPVD